MSESFSDRRQRERIEQYRKTGEWYSEETTDHVMAGWCCADYCTIMPEAVKEDLNQAFEAGRHYERAQPYNDRYAPQGPSGEPTMQEVSVEITPEDRKRHGQIGALDAAANNLRDTYIQLLTQHDKPLDEMPGECRGKLVLSIRLEVDGE